MIKAAFELSLKVGKIPVLALPHISQNIIGKVAESKKFKDYVQKIDNCEEGVKVSQIEILGVQMFGERVGFINLRAVTSKDGFNLPSYVFLRGPSVAILLFVNKKLLLVQQYRVPIQSTILQAPAGMLDESGDFVGVAALQIQEQTSIKLSKDKLHSLGSFFPSCGGCDEQVSMFYSEIELPEAEMQEIEKKIHGQENSHEKIKVKFLDYDPNVIIATKDSKLISLVYAYENRHLIKPKI